MHTPLLCYLTIINALGFGFMLADKYKARHHLWRIRERTLLLIAFFGGSLGSLMGMYLVRHKTKHKRFTVTVPLMLAGHVCIGICLYRIGLL